MRERERKREKERDGRKGDREPRDERKREWRQVCARERERRFYLTFTSLGCLNVEIERPSALVTQDRFCI